MYGSIENFLLITWNPNTIQKVKGSPVEIVLDSSIISYWHYYYYYLYVFNFTLYLEMIVIDEALTTVILCHFYKTLNQRHSYNFFLILVETVTKMLRSIKFSKGFFKFDLEVKRFWVYIWERELHGSTNLARWQSIE